MFTERSSVRIGKGHRRCAGSGVNIFRAHKIQNLEQILNVQRLETVYSIVERRVSEGNTYLFSMNGKKVSAAQYYSIWNGIMEQLGQTHTPHECRHTFRSRLDSAGANKVCIDWMMGHKSKEVGERVYTHKTIQELRTAIELITG